MTLHTSTRDADRQNRLSGDDWIETALDVLVQDGIEAVQITVLARKLGVTDNACFSSM